MIPLPVLIVTLLLPLCCKLNSNFLIKFPWCMLTKWAQDLQNTFKFGVIFFRQLIQKQCVFACFVSTLQMTNGEMFKSVSVVSLRSKSWPVASHLAPASPPWSLWPAWILGPHCRVAQPAVVRFPPEGPRYITASGSLPRKPCCSGSANSVTSKHQLNTMDTLNVQENFDPTNIS